MQGVLGLLVFVNQLQVKFLKADVNLHRAWRITAVSENQVPYFEMQEVQAPSRLFPLSLVRRKHPSIYSKLLLNRRLNCPFPSLTRFRHLVFALKWAIKCFKKNTKGCCSKVIEMYKDMCNQVVVQYFIDISQYFVCLLS